MVAALTGGGTASTDGQAADVGYVGYVVGAHDHTTASWQYQRLYLDLGKLGIVLVPEDHFATRESEIWDAGNGDVVRLDDDGLGPRRKKGWRHGFLAWRAGFGGYFRLGWLPKCAPCSGHSFSSTTEKHSAPPLNGLLSHDWRTAHRKAFKCHPHPWVSRLNFMEVKNMGKPRRELEIGTAVCVYCGRVVCLASGGTGTRKRSKQ